MAKPTKHAGTICTILTILALVGIALGLLTSNALVIVLFLIFEPRGLAEIWNRMKAFFRLWPFSY